MLWTGGQVKLMHGGGNGLPAKSIVTKGCLPVGCWLAAALFCLVASLPGRPVDALCIQREDGGAWHVPVPLGQTVTTWYCHSVERTLVADSYYPMSGRLHQWRTLSRSHNAGLPWKTPEHGRFLTEGDWLVLEGGLPAWESIRLRVGNERLGRNELQIGRDPEGLCTDVTQERYYAFLPGEFRGFSVGLRNNGTDNLVRKGDLSVCKALRREHVFPGSPYGGAMVFCPLSSPFCASDRTELYEHAS